MMVAVHRFGHSRDENYWYMIFAFLHLCSIRDLHQMYFFAINIFLNAIYKGTDYFKGI